MFQRLLQRKAKESTSDAGSAEECDQLLMPFYGAFVDASFPKPAPPTEGEMTPEAFELRRGQACARAKQKPCSGKELQRFDQEAFTPGLGDECNPELIAAWQAHREAACRLYHRLPPGQLCNTRDEWLAFGLRTLPWIRQFPEVRLPEEPPSKAAPDLVDHLVEGRPPKGPGI